MGRLKMKDLARALDLSTSTVSRALSGHPDISKKTRERVMEAAKSLNFSINAQARSFRTQNSRLIALILPEINTFYSPGLIKGMNELLETTEYSLITFLSNDSVEREEDIISQCIKLAVEGVLISLSKETESLDHLSPLIKSNIQCVLFDKSLYSDHFSSVTIDNFQSSMNATNQLIQMGHKNILAIMAEPTLTITQERLSGYRQALQLAGITPNDEYVISMERGGDISEALTHILQHDDQITAIYTMSDELLSICLYHLNRLQIKIPEQISVISISDGVYPMLCYPRISHIKDSGEKMGKTAADVLHYLVKTKNMNDRVTRRLHTEMVQLDSIRAV